METLVQNKDHLILEAKPTLGRIIGYTLIVSGLILILPNPYKSRVDFYLYAGIVLVVIGMLIHRMLPENVRCTFDKGKGKLKISRIKPLQRGWEETYELEQISKIRIESKPNKSKQTRYRLALQMDKNQWVPLTKAFTQRNPEESQALAEKIQAFL
ncbi:MAG: hypothetical protein AAF694_05210 [Bacteroidota bacterium]